MLLWLFITCVHLVGIGLTRTVPSVEGFQLLVGMFSFFTVMALDFYARKKVLDNV
jgi:hypothetical protein